MMHAARWTCAALLAMAPWAVRTAAGAPSLPIVLAADAANPYGNIDHSNDAGNDTGDSQVDNLNSQQLNENYKGPYYYGNPPPAGTRPPQGAPAYAMRPPPPLRPPPGYAQPGYAQPGYPPPGYPPPGYVAQPGYPPPGY